MGECGGKKAVEVENKDMRMDICISKRKINK